MMINLSSQTRAAAATAEKASRRWARTCPTMTMSYLASSKSYRSPYRHLADDVVVEPVRDVPQPLLASDVREIDGVVEDAARHVQAALRLRLDVGHASILGVAS
jgi:hypothetical protein